MQWHLSFNYTSRCPANSHARIPRFLADWEHILSSPHCSWQPCSHVASRIFNLTRLFLSGSGREQGSCQFESWARTWQSWVDRRSGGGAMCTPSVRHHVGLSPRHPHNSAGFKLSCSERASLYSANWFASDTNSTRYPVSKFLL